MIDLHCHSHFSDGGQSPEALLKKALDANIAVLALTDHDTVNGLAALHQAAVGQNIRIINGIELSVRWKKTDIHILGLNIDPTNPAMAALIAMQNESRITRAKQIAEKMQLLGISRAYERACEIAGHERVGRPHFAKVFMEENAALTMQNAFKRYLGRGKSAYAPTPWISITEAVEGILEAKGQAVLAHPLKYSLTRTKLHELIVAFKEAGGRGIEVVSGEVTVSQIQEMAGLSIRYALLASSGSDYHDDGISRILLGRQRQLPVNCTPVWEHWDSE
ncbi:MAG: PHP domain-containing protein [Tatlockia sp.]